MRVILVGRPNSGKSSLFNQMVYSLDSSVVSPIPGVTKDWKCAKSRYGWDIIDTPGFEKSQEPWWWLEFTNDLIIWVLDVSEGITELDDSVFKFIKKSKNVIVCWNKSDISQNIPRKNWGLDLCLVSAKKREGFDDMMILIEKYMAIGVDVSRETLLGKDDILLSDVLHNNGTKGVSYKIPRYLIVGQPNAGKSSLVNALTKRSRVLVSDVPGTTVDCINVDYKLGSICDTPGIKRRKYDGYMSDAIMNAVKKIEKFRGVILYVVDASQLSVVQDLKLASLIWSTGNPVLCLLNKWDLVKGKKVSEEWLKNIQRAAPTIKVMPISTKTRLNLSNVHEAACELLKKWSTRIGTGELNRWCEKVIMPRRAKIQYISQVDITPPRLFIAGKRLCVDDRKYITRKFRETFKFNSIPIRVDREIF